MAIINNPGNLRPSGDKWQGMIPSPAPGFLAFSTPEYGYRALFINLNSYFKSGRDTVTKIISSWAPSNENDTKNYIKFVSNQIGFPPDVKLPNTEATFKAIGKAIATMEKGKAPDLAALNKGYEMAALKKK
jgi:hypothetical protein